MFLRLFLVVCFAVSSYARTPEEIKKWFMQVGMECNKDHPISPEEMVMLQSHKIPESKNIKCLMACVFKRPKWAQKVLCWTRDQGFFIPWEDIVILTTLCKRFDAGTFDIDKAEEMLETEFGDDTEKKDNGKKLFDVCRSDLYSIRDSDSNNKTLPVNDATVNDGAAGCERSHLLTHCLIEHAPKFGFDLKHVRLI